jgi:hypothetical protein
MSDKPRLTQVTPANPCPVCGHGNSHCARRNRLILCRKSQGPVSGFDYKGPSKKDSQWAIYLDPQGAPQPHPGPPGASGHPIDWSARAAQYANALTIQTRYQLAQHLKLPETPLMDHGIGYRPDDQNGPCWTFPERNGAGAIIGISRRYANGAKKAMYGGQRGLFVPSGWSQRERPVFCPEGPSDALALTALGLAAVGRPSNAAGVEHLAALFKEWPADRPIVIVGEYDPNDQGQWPGKDGAVKVAADLSALLRRPVHWVLPPKGHKDVRAWALAQNLPTSGEAIDDSWREMGEQLLAAWQHKHKQADPPPTPGQPGAGLATTCLASIRPAPIAWLVPDHLPLGKLVLYAGDGGLGKSMLTLHLTAAITQGQPALGLEYCPPAAADVLLVSCEDDFADTVVPRLLAAGADLQRIRKVDGIRGPDGKLLPFSLAHYEQLKKALQAQPDIRLVVIDPAAGYVGKAGKDSKSNAELRSLLDPLAELAACCKVTVVMVAHCNKAAATRAVHKVLDSVGWVNTVRAAYLVAADPDDQDLRLVLHLKGNLSAPPPGRAYRLQPLNEQERAAVLPALAHLDAADQHKLLQQLVKINWVGETKKTADEIVAWKPSDGPDKTAKVAEWLLAFLDQFAYPSSEVISAGEKAGYSRGTLFAAKKRLGDAVKASNKGSFQGAWWWGIGEPQDWVLRPDAAT